MKTSSYKNSIWLGIGLFFLISCHTGQHANQDKFPGVIFSQPEVETTPTYLDANWIFNSLDGNRSWLLKSNPDNTVLMAADLQGNQIFNLDMEDLTIKETISTPENFLIEGMCLTDEIWIINAERQIISYDLEKKMWTEHLEFDNLDLLPYYGCLSNSANHVLFSGENWIAEYKNGSWEFTSLDFIDVPANSLMTFTFDQENRLWAITERNEIYVFQEDWEQVGKVESQSRPYELAITQNDVVWIGVFDKLFMWPTTQGNQNIFSFMEPIGNSFFVNGIYQIHDDVAIVTGKGIINYSAEGVSIINNPDGVEHIRNSVFSEKMNKLFITTKKGVYSTVLP